MQHCSIDILSARGLRHTNFSQRHSLGRRGTINAHVAVDVEGVSVYKTRVVAKSSDPEWNESHEFMAYEGQWIRFVVFDEDKYVADVSVEVGTYMEREWVALNPRGELLLALHFDADRDIPDTEVNDTSPVPMRRNAAFKRRVVVVNQHRFMLTYFRQPTFCAICSHFIWGVASKQGFQCQLCALVTHKRCLDLVLVTCPKASYHKQESTGFKIDVRHQFEVYNYLRPTTCKHCGSLLYGLIKQGLRCKNCKMDVHKRCKDYIPNHCGVNLKDLAILLREVGHSTTDVDSISRKESRISHKRFLEDFQLLLVLGQGSFGKVLLARDRVSGEEVAIKSMKKHIIQENDDVECLMLERDCLLLGTDCPFIAKLICSFQQNAHVFMVIEFCPGGDLMFLLQQRRVLPERVCSFYGGQIVIALSFLHSRKIIYRDLKLDNIMLDSTGYIKLVDFGMCKDNVDSDHLATTFCGTPDYISPEMIVERPYGASVDWWAFGVLLYEFLVGQPPFDGEDEDELFSNIVHQKIIIPSSLSPASREVLVKFMVRNPNKRMGGKGDEDSIFQLEFFSHYQRQSLEDRTAKPPLKPQTNSYLLNFDKIFTSKQPKLSVVDSKTVSKIHQYEFQYFDFN